MVFIMKFELESIAILRCRTTSSHVKLKIYFSKTHRHSTIPSTQKAREYEQILFHSVSFLSIRFSCR